MLDALAFGREASATVEAIHGNGKFERKVAFLSANRAVVNPPGNEVGIVPPQLEMENSVPPVN